jgi:hypothetical protein
MSISPAARAFTDSGGIRVGEALLDEGVTGLLVVGATERAVAEGRGVARLDDVGRSETWLLVHPVAVTVRATASTSPRATTIASSSTTRGYTPHTVFMNIPCYHGRWWMYYGAGDSVLGLATTS